MLTFFLKRMTKKDRISAYLASLPDNGRRDDELEELIHRAYEGKRHVHLNPPKGIKKNRKEVVTNVE